MQKSKDEFMTLNLIKEKIVASKNIVILGHISPDPDAIGSVFALSECLENVGKKVFRVFQDEIPSNLKFILNGNDVIHYFPCNENVDLVIFCDCSCKTMIGEKILENFNDGICSICIDHHESNDNYANINYVIKSACATCEIMYGVLKVLELKITESVASALYAGLSADTGSFRFSSTTDYTFFVAQELTRLGADIYNISTNLWSSKSKKAVNLLKVMLNRLEFSFDDRLAISFLTQDDMQEIGADKSDISGLIGNIRDIEGVILAVFFYEEENNWKMSTRSKDLSVSTLPITESFGGGGHFMASGARFSKELTPLQIVDKVKDIVKDLLKY